MKRLLLILGLLLGGSPCFAAPSLTDGLVAYWPCNETDASAVVADATGRGNSLALSSGDTLASYQGGRSILIADQAYASIADNADLSLYNTSFTLRIKLMLLSKPASQMYILNKWRTTATAQREYAIFWSNTTDRFSVSIGSPSGGSGTTLVADNFGAPTIGVWYNITVWYDHLDSVLAIQVDDGAPNRTTQSTSPMDGTASLFLGALANPTPSLFSDIAVKDVGIWRRVLSPAEIKGLNNSGNSRTYADLQSLTFTNPWMLGMVDGVRTWFNSPVMASSLRKLWFGGFPRTGEMPKIAELDLDTGEIVVGTINQAVGETDDHDDPSIIRLKSGYLLAVFSHHNGDCWAARSTNKEDASAWEAAVKIEDNLQIAYAQVMQADYQDTIYHFCRYNVGAGTHYPQGFFTSTDDGATWSTFTEFVSTGNTRPYFRWWRTSGTRFDFICTTGQPDEAINSLYAGYVLIDPLTGALTIYKSDGTLIGDASDLPLSLSDLTLVYDGTTSECWIWDYKRVKGTLTAVFAVFPSHATTAAEYHQARLVEGVWTTEKICDAGTTGTADYLYAVQQHYSGGVTQDPNDIDKVYVSREFGASDFRVHAVEKIDSTWTITDWLSEFLTYQVNARPYAWNVNGKTFVTFWGGTYASFSNYNTNMYVSPESYEAIDGRNSIFAGVVR
jgi:hypothetical protein